MSLFLTCWRRAGGRYRPHRQPQLRLGWDLQVAGQSGRWLSSLLYQTSWGRTEGLGTRGKTVLGEEDELALGRGLVAPSSAWGWGRESSNQGSAKATL